VIRRRGAQADRGKEMQHSIGGSEVSGASIFKVVWYPRVNREEVRGNIPLLRKSWVRLLHLGGETAPPGRRIHRVLWYFISSEAVGVSLTNTSGEKKMGPRENTRELQCPPLCKGNTYKGGILKREGSTNPFPGEGRRFCAAVNATET